MFSHLTALYFHNLCEKVPNEYDITVNRNYNGFLCENKKVDLHYVSNEILNLGKMEIISPQGKSIVCYDIERCLCDMIKEKDRTYFEYVKYAFASYYREQKHDTLKLFKYAKKMGIYDKVAQFMEILL